MTVRQKPLPKSGPAAATSPNAAGLPAKAQACVPRTC